MSNDDYTINGTAPIVAYYGERVFVIDGINTKIYFSYTQETDPEWDEPDTSLDSWITNSSLCRSAKCFTQIDDTLYIIYDESSEILIYDLDGRAWVNPSNPTSFAYPGYWSLANNGTHIFGIGQETNILIVDVADLETAYWSTPYISNGEMSTIAMDSTLTSLYIFNEFAALLYCPINDTLTTLYGRESSAWLSTSNIVSSNGYNNVIMVKGDEYLYPFSSETNKFLQCRAENSPNVNLGSLMFIDQNLFEFGGITDDSYTSLFTDTFTVDAINTITYVYTQTINAHKLQLNDWYYPNTPIGINYTESFIDDYTYTGYIGIDLISDDWELGDTNIYFSNNNDEDECEVCYGGEYFPDDCNYCKTDGLTVENLLSSTTDFDAQSTVYSIEATMSNADDVVDIGSSDGRFVCDSYPIYPVYIALTISLYADELFYLNVDYEYKCNGCSVSSFADASLYDFSSTIVLEANVFGIDNDVTVSIENQQSCVVEDGDGVVYGCDNYTLPHVTEIYFDGEYSIDLSSTDTFLESDSVLLTLSAATTMCKTGTGYNSDMNACAVCPEGSFSLRPTLSACTECGGVEGISCSGSNVITVDYRYWVSGYRQSTEQYVTLYEMNNATDGEVDILVSSICGSGQCCGELDGCDYMTMFEEGTLCSANRDLTSAMCTGCIDGYYMLLSTNECGYAYIHPRTQTLNHFIVT